MSAPRFAYDNLVHADDTVISSSSELAAFPSSWLRDPLRSKRWRTATGWTVLAGFNDEVLFSSNDGVRLGHIAQGTYATGAAYATAVAAAMNAAGYNPRATVFSGSGATCSGWWRADSVTVNSAGLVSQIDDISGNNRHATEATDLLKPLWAANATNGRPAMYFDDTDAMGLSTGLPLSTFLDANGRGTMFVVFRLDSDATGYDILTGVANFEMSAYWTSGLNFGVAHTDATSTKTAAKAGATGVSAWHSLGWRYDQSNLGCFVDDFDDAAAGNTAMTAVAKASTLASIFQIGMFSTVPIKGHVAEVIIFDKPLTQQERRGVEAYIIGRYTAIVDTTTAVTWAVTLGCTYSGTTKKFTIARTAGAGNISLLTLSGVPSADRAAAAFPDLGFSIAADKTGATTYTADTVSYQSAHWIKVDLGAITATLAGVLLDHNVSSDGLIYQQGNDSDSWVAAPTVKVLSSTSTDGAARFATWSTVSRRWLRIAVSDVTNPDGYCEIGVWFTGAYVAPSFVYNVSFRKTLEELSQIGYGTHGSHFVDERPQRLAWAVMWDDVPEADRALFELLATTLPLGQPFFVQWEPTGTPAELNYVFRRDPLVEQLKTAAPLWDIALSLAEALG